MYSKSQLTIPYLLKLYLLLFFIHSEIVLIVLFQDIFYRLSLRISIIYIYYYNQPHPILVYGLTLLRALSLHAQTIFSFPPFHQQEKHLSSPRESLWPRSPFLYLYINIMIGWNFFLLSLFKVSKTRFSSNIVKTCPLHPLVPSSTKHSISRYTRVSYYAVCL